MGQWDMAFLNYCGIFIGLKKIDQKPLSVLSIPSSSLRFPDVGGKFWQSEHPWSPLIFITRKHSSITASERGYTAYTYVSDCVS